MEETSVLKEQFGELASSGTWEEEGKVESDARFGNVSSSRGAEGSWGLLLATGNDAKVVCGAGWSIGTELDTTTGPTVGVQVIGASQKQKWHFAREKLEARSFGGCIGAVSVFAGGTKPPGGERQGFTR